MSLLKATVLSVGLLGATVLAAQAQSVSSVQPGNPATSTAPAQPLVSTQRIGPDPGGSVGIKAEHYQSSANAGSALADHPYSSSIDHTASGPKPN
ncbi:MAG: hypothetical protein WB611_28010 [Stellaceae bacterium]